MQNPSPETLDNGVEMPIAAPENAVESAMLREESNHAANETEASEVDSVGSLENAAHENEAAPEIQSVPVADSVADLEGAPPSENLPSVGFVETAESESVTPTDEIVESEVRDAASEEPTGALVVPTANVIEHAQENLETEKSEREVLAGNVSTMEDDLRRANFKIAELEEKLNQITAKLEISTQVATNPSAANMLGVLTDDTPPLQFETQAWIEKALSGESESLQNDSAELEKYAADAAKWSELTSQFNEKLAAALPVFAEKLDTAESHKNGVLHEKPLSGHLQTKAESALKGLRLTQTMLGRAAERAKDLGAISSDVPTFAPRSQEEWAARFQGATSDEEAAKILKTQLSEGENARYQLISQSRNSAESTRKKMIGFIEKQILPIADGVDDGKRHTLPDIEAVRERDPDNGPIRQQFEAWFEVFDALRDALREVLGAVGVQTLDVPLGAPIDYNTQEPFETVEDTSKNTEDVAEVVRSGYVYSVGEGSFTLLRPAQVVVVKN